MVTATLAAPTRPRRRQQTLRLWAQTAVALLAFGVFTAGVTSESLWLDEVSSIYNAQLAPLQVMQEAAADTHPPLYYLLLHLTVRILSPNQTLHGSTGEFIARWPSVAAGVLAAVALASLAHRLAHRLILHPTTSPLPTSYPPLPTPHSLLPTSYPLLPTPYPLPALAGAFYALSTYARWYAQEARMYSLLTLWGILATYALVRAAAHPNRRWPSIWFIAYIVLCAAGLYTHYYFILLLLAHNLLILWSALRGSPVQVVRWLLIQAAIALLFIPWLPTLLTQVGRGEGLWIALAVGRPDLPTLAYALIQFIGMPISGPAILRYASYALALACLLWGGRRLLRPAASQSHTLAPGAVVLTYALIPVAVALLVSQVRPIFASRYLLLALPAWSLLLAVGVVALPWPPLRWATAVLLLGLAGAAVTAQAVTLENPPWREAVGWIKAQAQHGDFAVFIPSFHWRPFTYYAGRDASTAAPDAIIAFEEELWLPNDDLDWRAQFAAAAQGRRRIWLIWRQAHWGDPQGRVRQMLAAQATLLSERTFPGIDLVQLYALTGADLRP